MWVKEESPVCFSFLLVLTLRSLHSCPADAALFTKLYSRNNTLPHFGLFRKEKSGLVICSCSVPTVPPHKAVLLKLPSSLHEPSKLTLCLSPALEHGGIFLQNPQSPSHAAEESGIYGNAIKRFARYFCFAGGNGRGNGVALLYQPHATGSTPTKKCQACSYPGTHSGQRQLRSPHTPRVTCVHDTRL